MRMILRKAPLKVYSNFNPATLRQQFKTSAEIFGAKLNNFRAHHTYDQQISGNICLHNN